MDLLIRRPIIKSQMQELPMSKRYQMKGRNLQEWSQVTGLARRFRAYVKKVRTPRLQGLDPGETQHLLFPFRLKKSLK
jgi:hypothetical protein